MHFPWRSHNLAVTSPDPVNSVFPSGENATARTGRTCPVKTCRLLPFISHSREVISFDPVKTNLPSGEKATDKILSYPFLTNPCASVTTKPCTRCPINIRQLSPFISASSDDLPFVEIILVQSGEIWHRFPGLYL